MNLTVIDFTKLDNKEEQEKLHLACMHNGYFALENHGVNAGLQRRLIESIHTYFSQDTAEKLRQERSDANPFGFYNKELTKNLLDHKEVFDISLNAEPATLWPNDEAFIQATSHWYEACHEVAIALLSKIFDCLAVPFDPTYFALHTSFLRLNYYPKIDKSEQDASPKLGISHHTDAGALTLLLQEDVPGLQFLTNDEWHTAPAIPDHFLVNLGDMLQVWSNDLYKAPLHRVLTNTDQDRYSAPYFLNPSYTTDVKPLNTDKPLYRGINWYEFRSGRAAGDYADLGEEIQIEQYRL